jgi:hypothetical protein
MTQFGSVELFFGNPKWKVCPLFGKRTNFRRQGISIEKKNSLDPKRKDACLSKLRRTNGQFLPRRKRMEKL